MSTLDRPLFCGSFTTDAFLVSPLFYRRFALQAALYPFVGEWFMFAFPKSSVRPT
jgi:hypothetical protein